MSRASGECYEFGPFRLDKTKRLLSRDNAPVALTSKAFETLLALIEHAGEVVAKDDLLSRVWPDTVVEEKNLTVTISALRKALGETPDEHRFIVTIPGRGYRFVADVRPSAVEQPKPSGANYWAVAGMAILLLLVIRLAYSRFGDTAKPAPSLTVRSLAVLPFKSLTAADDDKLLGLGMTDALITQLSNVGQIIVRPTRAVRKYAESEQEPTSIGRDLRVDLILQGTIQRSTDRIRVTAQLVQLSDNKVLWGQAFDEKFTGFFAVEDAISRRLTEALRLQLTGKEQERLVKRQTENIEAYRFYLQGRNYARERTLEGFQKSVELFNRAIEFDPTYALAYAGIADTYYAHSTVNLSLEESVSKAKAAALEALRLDDSLAEAHTSLAMIKFHYDWDWTGAESEFRKAIDLNPNYVTAHQWFSEYLTAVNRPDQAIAEAKRAEQIDPLAPDVGWNVGFALLFARRYDDAIRQLEGTVRSNPRFPLAHTFLGWAYEEKGELDKALQEVEMARALADNPDTLSALGRIYVDLGRKDDARRIIDQLQRQSKQKYVSPFFIAVIYLALGENDRGFEWMEKAYREHAELLVFQNTDPHFANVRSDPRFKDLVHRVGIIE